MWILDRNKLKQWKIRKTIFWWYPPLPHDYPYYWPVPIGSQAHIIDQFIFDPKPKQDKVKDTKFKEFAKTFNSKKKITCETPYEVACHYSVHRWTDGQTDGRTKGWMDKVKPVYPLQLCWVGGIIICTFEFIWILTMSTHQMKKKYLSHGDQLGKPTSLIHLWHLCLPAWPDKYNILFHIFIWHLRSRLIHWPLGDVAVIINWKYSNSY